MSDYLETQREKEEQRAVVTGKEVPPIRTRRRSISIARIHKRWSRMSERWSNKGSPTRPTRSSPAPKIRWAFHRVDEEVLRRKDLLERILSNRLKRWIRCSISESRSAGPNWIASRSPRKIASERRHTTCPHGRCGMYISSTSRSNNRPGAIFGQGRR